MALSLASKIRLSSGTHIPIVGLGTYSLKGEPCSEAVKAALNAGYRHIDTGSIFNNEKEIADSIKECNLTRKDVYIGTKVGPAQHGYKESIDTCNKIMEKLQTDYLDLVLIHWPGSNKCTKSSQKVREFRSQTWKGLIELKEAGKVKDIGVSNFMMHHLEHLEKASGVKPALNQFEVHPLLWQKQLIDYCRQNDIVIEAYSPLARGELRLFENDTLIDIAKKHNKTVSQVCLRWSLQQGFVTLPRSKQPGHIKENVEIFDFELSESEMSSISSLETHGVRVAWNGADIVY